MYRKLGLYDVGSTEKFEKIDNSFVDDLFSQLSG